MRVLIVGAGAVGSFLGWAVVAGGGHATLVRRGQDALPEVPLRLIRPDGAADTVRVAVLPSVEAAAAIDPRPELVILAVRQFDLPAVLETLDVLPATTVLTAQNGVGAEETVLAARPGAPLLGASVTASVERDPDGTVRWLRRGGVGLAAVRAPATDQLGELAAILRTAGVRVAIRRSAAAMKWSKLVANLVGNATSGLLDLDPAAIYDDPRLFDVERDQLREALAVMDARGLRPVDLPGVPVRLLAIGIALPPALSRLALRRVVGSARGGKDPSLRGAVAAGGTTEVGWLNGAVARAGAESGVPTPVNAALARLVDEAATDHDRRAWFRHHPDRLLAELGQR
jgi:2-dehydropantoate 2-reductase